MTFQIIMVEVTLMMFIPFDTVKYVNKSESFIILCENSLIKDPNFILKAQSCWVHPLLVLFLSMGIGEGEGNEFFL